MKIHNEQLLENFYKHDKLNVAILSDIFYPNLGGAAVVAKEMAEAFFRNKDVNVVVITGEVKGFTDDLDFPIIRCKALRIPKALGDSLPTPNFDHKFKKLIKKLNLDIIHLHTVFGICTFGLKFAKKNNIPVVMHGHSKFNEEYKTIMKNKFIYKIITKRAYNIISKTDLILPVSEHTKQNYLLNCTTPPPMFVLPNTTNLKLLENKDNEIENLFKEKYNILLSDNVLLWVGRIEIECKNLDFLFNSLKILKDKQFDFKLFIVGSGKDEKALKQLCEKLGLDDNIIFVGQIKDRILLSKYYYFSKLLCFPSTVDNCPIVKLEAGSQKTPTLAIRGSASAEVIVDGFNGYTCELEENAFADKIIQIFSDKDKLKEVSDNAYKTLNIGWDAVAQTLVEKYKELIDKNKKN